MKCGVAPQGYVRQTFETMIPRAALGLACFFLLAACVDRTAPPVVPTTQIAVTEVSRAPLETEPARRGVGDEIEVEWQGAWYAAVIRESRGALWLIHYEGYGDEWDEVVGDDRIRDRRESSGVDEHESVPDAESDEGADP